MRAFVFACSAAKEKRENIFFANAQNHCNTWFGVCKRVRIETASSPSAPDHLSVWVRRRLVWFSLVQLGFLQQGVYIPRRQNHAVSVLLTLSSTASHSCPSPRSTPGSCRRSGSSRWSHDCCGRCRDGSKPGVVKNKPQSLPVSRAWAEARRQGVCFVCGLLPWTGNTGMWIDGPSQSRRQWPGGFYRGSYRQRWRQCRPNRRATSLRTGRRVRRSEQTGVKHWRRGEEASSHQTRGSPEGSCRRPSQCLWWSPHWPPAYTLRGSLRTWLHNIGVKRLGDIRQ